MSGSLPRPLTVGACDATQNHRHLSHPQTGSPRPYHADRPGSEGSLQGAEVGVYKADLLVDQRVLVELKVARQYTPEDEAQLLNELKATGMKVGLLINFGREKVGFKRFVF